ncbi:MAG: cell envelope integrity protein TolA [Xanthobacteraceae bacterium]
MQACLDKLVAQDDFWIRRASLASSDLNIWSPLPDRSFAGPTEPPDRDGRAPVLVRVEPIAADLQQPSTERARRWIGIVVASALHAGALIALVLAGPPEPSGGGGQWLDAISVEIVVTPVIAARDAQNEVAAAANAPVAPDEGDPSKPDVNRQETANSTPDHPTLDPERPNTERTLAEEVPLPQPDSPLTERTPQQQAEPKPRASEPSNRGGVTALGAERESHMRARASASPGAIQRYAMQVRAALARNKPDGHGRRGTAVITFAISPNGKLSFARVSTPSGSAGLDQAALSAVQRTSFPPPPDHMTDSQLTYAVPFHFK